MLGGSGQGEQIAANKVRGVRAALCNDLFTARLARAAQRRQRAVDGRAHRRARRSPRRSCRSSSRPRSRAAATSRRARPRSPKIESRRGRVMSSPLEQHRPGHRRHHRARGRAAEHDGPADRVGELHVAAPCSRRRARCSPTSTPRAIRPSGTTAATTSSTTPRSSPGDRACELFGAEHANVQPHSGANANMAAFLAVLEPGDKVMGMRLDQGGHLTHGSPVNFSGRIYDFVAYGVDDTDRDARLRRDPRARRSASARSMIIAGRDGVLAHHRLRGVPLDRRRGRRAAAGRRRAHRRSHRRRRAPVAGAASPTS